MTFLARRRNSRNQTKKKKKEPSFWAVRTHVGSTVGRWSWVALDLKLLKMDLIISCMKLARLSFVPSKIDTSSSLGPRPTWWPILNQVRSFAYILHDIIPPMPNKIKVSYKLKFVIFSFTIWKMVDFIKVMWSLPLSAASLSCGF